MSSTSDNIYYVNSGVAINGSKNRPHKIPQLSIVVIAKNESDRIHHLLETAGFAGEMIVVDSGSTDGTPELCSKYGVTVIHHDWMGYGPQKQFALESASGEWILNLDADEAPSSELVSEIEQVLNSPGNYVAFEMPRMSFYLNRWIRHGGWYPDRKVRLVRKGFARWTDDGLHEKIDVTGNIGTLRSPILHWVYRDISDQLKTIDKFSSIAANSRSHPVSGFHVITGVVHAIGKFLECAVWKLGILDGIPGIVIAMNSAFYVFLRHAKSWEKNLQSHSSQHFS